MNTVDGSQFSKKVFLNNVTKKLCTLPGASIAVVGRYGFAVEAFACVPIILLLGKLI
jgi:nitrate reductase NapE component